MVFVIQGAELRFEEAAFCLRKALCIGFKDSILKIQFVKIFYFETENSALR